MIKSNSLLSSMPSLLTILISSLLITPTLARPFLTIRDPRPKCITLDLLAGMMIDIHYQILDSTLYSENRGTDAMGRRPPPSLTFGKENNARSLVITNIEEYDLHPDMDNIQRGISQTSKLIQMEGKIRYKLPRHDMVQICISSPRARMHHPDLISLYVIDVNEDEVEAERLRLIKEKELKDLKFQSEIQKLKEDAHAKMSQDLEHNRNQSAAKSHFLFMESQIQHMIGQVSGLIRNDDKSKQIHTAFHMQGLRMHRTFLWFPVVKVVCLLVAGFIQAKSIVSYLRSKRIIF